MKEPRGRPRKNLLTNLKNIPSQTRRKRGRTRKQKYEDELPEIYTQKGSEESENYFSTSEDEINDIENYEENLEENFEDDLEENFEKNFEQNFE